MARARLGTENEGMLSDLTDVPAPREGAAGLAPGRAFRMDCERCAVSTAVGVLVAELLLCPSCATAVAA